jgi:DNA helicase-2/ATP-dependent DNA helicase PcrA
MFNGSRRAYRRTRPHLRRRRFGKTRVLTHRIAYLLNEKKVFPDRILAVTFTNKAAGEMKARLEAAGRRRRPATSGSARSTRCACACCAATARRSASRATSRSWTTPISAIIRDVLHDLDFDERQIIAGRRARRDLEGQERLLARRLREKQHLVHRRAHRPGLSRIRSPSARVERPRFRRPDRATIELLENDEETRTRYQSSSATCWSTNIRTSTTPSTSSCAMLADEHKNLTVVGDDDQSIYSWRGSDYKNILRFEEDFPGAKIFKLEENYPLDADDPHRRERTGRATTRRAPRRSSSRTAPRARRSPSTAPSPNAPKRAT